jgi:hypothetical protein
MEKLKVARRPTIADARKYAQEELRPDITLGEYLQALYSAGYMLCTATTKKDFCVPHALHEYVVCEHGIHCTK